MRMHSNKNILTLLIFIFISSVIYFLFIKQIIYPTIIPMVTDNRLNLFADWSVIVNANLCDEKGYDVFLNNPCDNWNRKHVYGKVLLYLPFIKTFPKFYFLVFPILINLLFIFVIVSSIFKYENNKKFFLLFLIPISVPVLLAIERANIDIIIFMFVFLLANNKNIIINQFLIIIATLSKFYPICLSVIFLFEKEKKKIFVNLSIFFVITILILFFQLENLKKIFVNQGQFSSSGFGVYGFSFRDFVTFINNLNITHNNQDYNWVKYLYVVLFVFLPVTFFNFFYKKKIYYNEIITNLFNNNNYENRFYILSSIIILICYFSFSNFIYREIFILGLLPWVLKNMKDNIFILNFFYIICLKFFFTSIFVFLSRSKFLLNFDPIIIVAKHTLDFFIISIILHIFLFSFMKFSKRSLFN
jgi:hypothetical protein